MLKRPVVILTRATFLFVAPGTMNAQESGAAADNTKVNKRDQKSSAVAKENSTDRETSANIRRALMTARIYPPTLTTLKSLLETAWSLKGPVRSEEEKKTVEAKATEIAGPGKVNNMSS